MSELFRTNIITAYKPGTVSLIEFKPEKETVIREQIHFKGTLNSSLWGNRQHWKPMTCGLRFAQKPIIQSALNT